MATFDIGIDLGTTKIIIYRSDSGIALNEPSIVAYSARDGKVVAVGNEAYAMLGKTPKHIVAERPLKDGVISNHKLCELMIKEYIKRVCNSFFIKPRIILCIPSITTDVERRAVVEAALAAGARKVYLIEEPIAAAIGAGIDIRQANGNLIVDIGGGTTDVAVISLNGVVCHESIRVAGNLIDEEIIKYFALNYKLSIGQRMAENIKKQVGCVYEPNPENKTFVKGRNLLTGYPQQVEIDETTLYECILACVDKIILAIRQVLERTPPELIGDIYENGIVLTGGGALIGGIAPLIRSHIKIPVRVAEEPIEAVSIGTGKAFDYIDLLQDGFINASTYH
ncbi:MAG: rod shape-determining protein [Massiliimalia sp.]|jgi:rod shape-determining protein MreB